MGPYPTPRGLTAAGLPQAQAMAAQFAAAKAQGVQSIPTKLGEVYLQELAGLTPVIRSIYAERLIAAATAFVAGNALPFFNFGIGDQATNYGYPAGTLARSRTNLESGGRLPADEVFICNGISFESDNIVRADFRRLDHFQVELVENSGQTRVPLGQLREFAPVFYDASDFGTGAAGGAEVNFHRGGLAYITSEPLLVKRGKADLVDNTQIQLVCDEAPAGVISADLNITCRLLGVWYRIKPASRPPQMRAFLPV